jgi:hypothetical protein
MEIIAKSLNEPHISIMSGKLAGLQAINTDTVSNLFCQKMNSTGNSICRFCYSMNALNKHRKNCRPSFMGNSELLSKSLLSKDQIPFINQSFFRFHGHGEIINMTHLWNFVQIARANPHCTFALWTKRKDFVRQMMTKQKYTGIPSGKPANMILIYSNPKLDCVQTEPPTFFDKVFNNVTKPIYRKMENCTGQKCIECLACYSLNSGTDVIVERVK